MNELSRILIVDDERHNIKVLTELLRDDYKIMAAKTGEQALNAVQGPNPPDLILLDIMMPGIDGYEVCRKLKADGHSMHIPVIFVSALDASDDESHGFELGAVDYITKPFKPLIVKARVRTHIQLKQKSDLSIKRKKQAGTGFFSAKEIITYPRKKKMVKKPHILIVDDERFNIKTLAGLLHEDYKIMAAKTGEQALKTLQGEILPDLILLDIMMPGIDGYEVCERLKADERAKHIPVIFVTAVTEIEDAARGFQAGAVDFIQKPLNPVMAKARVDLHIKLHKSMEDLKEALAEVKKLSGLLPICSHCKKIRDDKGYWNQIESYIGKHSDVEFSHSICQECAKKHYPDLDIYDDDETQQ